TMTPERSRRLRPICFWCHGAPGIGLTRLRAYELLRLSQLEEEAHTALNTTAAALEAIGDVRLENFSLCHGLAGNSTALLEASTTLPKPSSRWRELAHRIAERGLQAHASPRDWLCGTHAYGAPGLMVGIAGIGHFYLRLYEPSLPSVLLIRPRELADQLRV